MDGSLERWTAKEMLAKCSLELAFERIQAQRKQRVNDVGVAGVEPAYPAWQAGAWTQAIHGGQPWS